MINDNRSSAKLYRRTFICDLAHGQLRLTPALHKCSLLPIMVGSGTYNICSLQVTAKDVSGEYLVMAGDSSLLEDKEHILVGHQDPRLKYVCTPWIVLKV